MHEVLIDGVRYIPAGPKVDKPELLDFEFDNPELGKTTIREYLKTLLTTLWLEKENFTGKRPFGASGWAWDLRAALIKAGAVPGEIEGGCVNVLDDVDAADRIINGLIVEMCKKSGG